MEGRLNEIGEINKEYNFSLNQNVAGKFKVVEVNNNTVTIELDDNATTAFKQFEKEKEDLNKRKFFSMGVGGYKITK